MKTLIKKSTQKKFQQNNKSAYKKDELKVFLEGASYQLIKLSIEYKKVLDVKGGSTGHIFEEIADQFVSYYMLLQNSKIADQIIEKLVDQTVEYAISKFIKLSIIEHPINTHISPSTLKGFTNILQNIKPSKNIDISQLLPVWYSAGLADEILKSKIAELSK